MADTKTKNEAATEWVDGSAYDFLGLTPEESAYVDLKLRLSKALREWRKRQPISQSALAKKLRSSQSRVAKMERGDPSVTIDLLLRGLILLGVSRSEIARVLVFDEPKSLNLRSVAVATTGESKKPFHWSNYKYCPGKSAGEGLIKTHSSGDPLPNSSPIADLIHKNEVAYV